MSIKVHIPSAQETLVAHAQRGWQCPECFGVNITRRESRYSGASEDEFSCRECGAMWHREG